MLEITLHNTRLFIEQLVLRAENYSPGFEPAKPNLEIHVYRIETAARTEVPARVGSTGGRFSGPYGDESRRIHLRGGNGVVFDETAFVYITFPPTEAQVEQFFQHFQATATKIDKSYLGRQDAASRELLRSTIATYLNFALPSQIGHYEILAEYQSRDERFWPNRLAASCQFDVKIAPELRLK